MSGSTTKGRRRSEADLSSQRVSAILGAAEEAATRIRAEAESRMKDRIAEGARAADARVASAEAEAEEILSAAKAAAETERAEGASQALATIGAAEEDADRMRTEAEQAAKDMREQARAEARDMVSDARAAADLARIEGAALTGHLQELSASLRTNAERLTRDIRHTQAALTGTLDAVDPGSARPAGRSSSRGRGGTGTSPGDAGGEFDVPEFIPGG